MPTPTLAQLTIPGADLRDGRPFVSEGSPALLSLLCTNSGEPEQRPVAAEVSWGDGEMSSLWLEVGLEETPRHQYRTSGLYQISVTVKNASGEVSSSGTSIWIENLPPLQKRLTRWKGLAVPDRRVGVQTVSQTSQPGIRSLQLVGTSTSGATTVRVYGSADSLIGGSYTISQPGKLYSSGTIVGASGNLLTLDSALEDSYDQRATIDVTTRSAEVSRGFAEGDRPWSFPTSTDSELVRASVMTCLMVDKYEIPHLPEFGSGLKRLIFSPNDESLSGLLSLDVSRAVSWEPRASVEVGKVDRLDNSVSVSLRVRYSDGAEDAVFNEVLPLNLQ